MPICRICHKQQNKTEFRIRTDTGKPRSECVRCLSAKSLAYYHTPKGHGIFMAAQQRYHATAKGKLSQQKGHKKYYRKNKEKRAAKSSIWNAIKRKELPKISTQKCIRCGTQAKHYHHYAGYKKKNWLKVIPVCAFCHKKEHQRPPELPENPAL